MKKILSLFLLLGLAMAAPAQQVTYTIHNGDTNGGGNNLLFATSGAFTNTFVPLASTNGGGWFTTNTCTNVTGVANVTKAHDMGFQVSFYGLTSDTTNALYFVASNSLDALTWSADPLRNWQATFNGTNFVQVITNFTSIGAIGYEKFSVRFPGAAGQSVSNLLFGYAAKNGL